MTISQNLLICSRTDAQMTLIYITISKPITTYHKILTLKESNTKHSTLTSIPKHRTSSLDTIHIYNQRSHNLAKSRNSVTYLNTRHGTVLESIDKSITFPINNNKLERYKKKKKSNPRYNRQLKSSHMVALLYILANSHNTGFLASLLHVRRSRRALKKC